MSHHRLAPRARTHAHTYTHTHTLAFNCAFYWPGYWCSWKRAFYSVCNTLFRWHTDYEGKSMLCSVVGKETVKVKIKSIISAHLFALFVWPWCQMEWKLKESGGYLGWHEQLLTEKQDLLVTIATLVLPTLMCCCVYSLFCTILILLKKELPGWGLCVDLATSETLSFSLLIEWMLKHAFTVPDKKWHSLCFFPS